MKINTAYDIGDQVTIDRSEDIIGLILGISIRGVGLNVTYDVAWFHNGSQYSAWIEEWRLNRWAE